ncbi:MAG: NADH-quinone oxidoreductase subunit NuoE [Chloroflexota bacterium]|nr:MAG: NADH-quinone oxidoreductase subunit NuoE [Chloroflexota bacterium]
MSVISADALERIRAVEARYPERRSALLPALHIAQNELGWLSREAMEDVAAALDLDPDQVEEVATFYTMYYKQPVGTYVLEVCKTLPCSILGADEIIDYISLKLGIKPGETTSDGMFSLFRVECLAACHRAPVMQVNHRYYQDLTAEKVDGLIEAARSRQLRAGGARGFEIRRTWMESVDPADRLEG